MRNEIDNFLKDQLYFKKRDFCKFWSPSLTFTLVNVTFFNIQIFRMACVLNILLQ